MLLTVSETVLNLKNTASNHLKTIAVFLHIVDFIIVSQKAFNVLIFRKENILGFMKERSRIVQSQNHVMGHIKRLRGPHAPGGPQAGDPCSYSMLCTLI
jgi:hypothetical protein